MMRASRSCDVAVIGGGLAGLCAARVLAAEGVDVRVLEAQDRVGGRTLTEQCQDGSFIDHGGQGSAGTLQAFRPLGLRLSRGRV